MSELRLFTSESVTEGHPDKVADQISDAILDELLRQDPHSRVAVETLVTTGQVIVAGEISTEGYVEIPEVVRQRIREIGYDSRDQGFDWASCGVSVLISGQSAEIAEGVETSLEARKGGRDKRDLQGAGDQGMMFGYATDETPEFMPTAIWVAHRLTQKLARLRRDGTLPYLRPDGKSQVTIGYDGFTPRSVETVVISAHHSEDVDATDLSSDLVRELVEPVLAPLDLEHRETKVLVNPSGPFTKGGPVSDTGLTGRKIIADTYGGAARHGGGAFSGKDPSKVDRSAAYALRWIAKNAVAAGLGKRIELQVAYAIGRAEPVGLYLDTFGTGTIPEERILAAIRHVFDLRPKAVIDELDLLRPVYLPTATYGHFGRDLPGFTWEALDRVDALRSAAGI